jgi:hypothetical protein
MLARLVSAARGYLEPGAHSGALGVGGEQQADGWGCNAARAIPCRTATSITAKHVVHSGEDYTATQLGECTIALPGGLRALCEKLPHVVAGSLRGYRNGNCAA